MVESTLSHCDLGGSLREFLLARSASQRVTAQLAAEVDALLKAISLLDRNARWIQTLLKVEF